METIQPTPLSIEQLKKAPITYWCFKSKLHLVSDNLYNMDTPVTWYTWQNFNSKVFFTNLADLKTYAKNN